MVARFGFDFGDRYFAFEGLKFAFRVCTLENVYGIDHETVEVTETDDGLRIESGSLMFAGAQRTCPGKIAATLRKTGDEVRFQVEAEHEQDIKGITILIRDLAAPVENEQAMGWPQQEVSAPFPIIETLDKGSATIMPATTDFRRRRWAVYKEYSENWILNLSEDQDYITRGKEFQGSEWILRRNIPEDKAVTGWYEMLEEERGLQRWASRTDIPDWFRKVSLVLNMHCEGWTGYVFNTFERQLQILRWIGSFIDGEKVLVYLPGWDGRYYWNYPMYQVSEECGGKDGLKKLVDGAHEMGMHVVPMFGLVASNYINTKKLGLQKAACRTGYDLEEICDWTEWDEDLSNDPIWQPLNVGESKFRKHLFSRISDITDTFGTDGMQLDITTWLPKDPKYNLLEGLEKLLADLRGKYKDFLVFGENGTDLHLPLIPFFHGMDSLPQDHPFHLYCRTAAHLFCGAPGRGSTGCFESGHNPYVRPQINSKTIPTLAVVNDTLPDHQDEVKEVIEVAKGWDKLNNL